MESTSFKQNVKGKLKQIGDFFKPKNSSNKASRSKSKSKKESKETLLKQTSEMIDGNEFIVIGDLPPLERERNMSDEFGFENLEST
jgi:uncharacterized Rossmann fold enzyme